jgi:hypothetical protein
LHGKLLHLDRVKEGRRRRSERAVGEYSTGMKDQVVGKRPAQHFENALAPRGKSFKVEGISHNQRPAHPDAVQTAQKSDNERC